MIKSKIDARERALELAVKTFETSNSFSSNLFMDWVKMFEQYLVGDAELPEVTDDNAHIKELLEIANKSFGNNRKCNDDMIDYMLKGDNVDVMSEIPCKSDVE